MPRGFGGGFGRGGFGRGGFGMRRGGMPLIGMGMGMGSPLLTGLMTGGIGYLLGKSSNQPPEPNYQQPPQQWTQQPPAPATSPDSDKLAQLKLLGELHDSGVLTEEEFTREKQRIMGPTASRPGLPQRCPNCGAPIPDQDIRGKDQIQCQYCGYTIKL